MASLVRASFLLLFSVNSPGKLVTFNLLRREKYVCMHIHKIFNYDQNSTKE